mgnify:CR=1 FL=1
MENKGDRVPAQERYPEWMRRMENGKLTPSVVLMHERDWKALLKDPDQLEQMNSFPIDDKVTDAIC